MTPWEGQRKARFTLFLMGAVLGSVFDSFHTHSGTTYYTHPWIFQMAWWVPLLFGAATVVIGDSSIKGDRWLGRPHFTPGWGLVVVGFALFGLVYFASGFLPTAGSFKVVFVLSGAVLLWVFFDPTWQAFLMGILTGLIGSLMEITLIHFDLFRYTSPDLWGIPYWLPLLYFGASIAVGNLSRHLESDFSKL